MKRQFLSTILVSIVLLLVSTSSVLAQSSFTETFSNTSYQDAAATTANWDTGTGNLTLFPFVSSQIGSAGGFGGQRVTVEGQYAYVGAGSGGLYIMDISDPAAPIQVSQLPISGYARGIDIEGELAYIAVGLSGLVVVDISDPALPVSVGSYNTMGYSWDVAVSGNYAYVADSAGGLVVFDVSNNTPVLVGGVDTPGNGYSIEVAGDYVYMVDGAYGLRIYDVTDPLIPVQMGQYNSPGSARGLAISGDRAYVADGNAGLRVVNISNPYAPVSAGSYTTPSSAEAIDILGDRAYVACGASGLVILDILNPSAPALLENVTLSNGVYGVCVSGHRAYLADSTVGLVVVEVAKPTSLELLAELGPGGSVTDVLITGNRAILTSDYYPTMTLVDISDPRAPVIESTYNHSSDIGNIALSGHFIYAADEVGVTVIDISNPAVPFWAGSFTALGACTDIQISGNKAYVGTVDSRLLVLDISVPTVPASPLYYGTGSAVKSVCVEGDLVYLMLESGTVRIYDFRNPAVVILLSSTSLGSLGEDITVVGDLAFVVHKYTDLKIYDISNPASLSYVGAYSAPGWSYDVAVDGDYAFLSAGSAGTLMLDVSDPTTPDLVGTFDHLGDSYTATVAGDHVFVGGYTKLHVLNAYQSDVEAELNLAASSSYNTYEDAVAARIIPTGVGAVSWEISPDHGATWLPADDGSWAHFDDTHSYLRWRSVLNWSPDATIAVDALQVEWLNEYAQIAGVEDIAGDQGGQVRLEWLRSGRDFVGDSQQISEYAVYRKVAAAYKSNGLSSELVQQSLAVQQHALAAAASGWDFVASVPVRVQDDYSLVVATLADSSITGGQHYTTFMVSAMTQSLGVFFDSPADSGYSVDNLAPNAPQALMAAYEPNSVTLDWDDATEADFRYFRVYRGTDSGFAPTEGNMVQEVAASGWIDPSSTPWNYFYKVSAVDFAGNESEVGQVAVASEVPGSGVARKFALSAAAPNPFNPATMLSFTLPTQTEVRLGIYDLAGRHIQTLVNETREAGVHQVMWDGRDRKGAAASSGIYLYRIEAGVFGETKRMTLLK